MPSRTPVGVKASATHTSSRMILSQFLAGYTLGKVIDDVPEHLTVNPGVDDFEQLSDELNPRADRGPGANDQRHRLVVSGI